MKQFNQISGLIIGLIITVNTNAQVSTANNFGGGGDYVGWNGNQNFPLQIRHNSNQPINIFTDSTIRMKLNETVSYAINGATNTNISRNGYLLLGQNNGFIGSGTPIYNTGAFSLLHLNGYGTSGIDELGYRNWMQTGITLTGNRDLSYFGLRQLGVGEDTTETVIAWSDDGSGANGPDDLAIRFFGGGADATTVSSDFTDPSDFDGINVARFTPEGRMGLGNTFGINAAGMSVGYVRPQNLLHMSLDGHNPVYLQISNQNGTGQTATDGLHFGYSTTSTNNLEAQINQRENDRLSLFSNNGERVRITHIGALNNSVAFNPGGLDDNLTRIGISHDPATPVTRPLSLLHLGYNVANATSNDGWRSWMDVGIFASQNSDHVYLGLKPEDNGSDAVLAWGDNSDVPDNFKMVFTIPASGLGIPSSSANGVEALRMTPTLVQGINTGIGGDPAANQYFGGSANPTATLEVNSWGATGASGGSSGLRFTNLNTSSPTATNPGDGVLAVNANGDVIYVEADNAPAIGNYCTATPNPLTGNFEIPLNDFNYYFTGQGTNPDSNNIGSSVGIGLNCGDPIPLAKLHVLQSVTNPFSVAPFPDNTSVAGFFENNAPGNAAAGVYATVYGEAELNLGGRFVVQGTGISASQSAVGAWGTATGALDMNAGVIGEGYGGDFNYGVYGMADSGTKNVAIYGYAPNATGFGLHYAGLFDGDVLFNGNVLGSQFNWTSDSIFKTSVDTITNPLSVIHQLQPKTYFYDTANAYNINFPTKRQYGFIAQQVEQILPELVSISHKPEKRDLLGNVVYPAVDYKSLNYNALFGIIVAAMQEQQHQIQTRDSVINSLMANDSILNSRLEILEKCINALNLCDNSQSMFKQSNSSPSSVTDVRLKDVQTIILNQNVPNPFAEQTLISYFLPDGVKTAAIIFHNYEGKQINRVEISERGKGEINVYADDLSSGIYTYTLVADGKIADTKRMVKR